MKTYECRKIKGNISVDGNINKPEWADIKEIKLVDRSEGTEPKQPTTAKIVWNDEYIYVAFHCEDNYINATMTKYNDKLYEEEVVEIFIDDDSDLKTYIEIEVNPLNALLHYCVHNNLKGKILTFARTDETVKTAVRRDDQKGIWDVEIAIPFSEFYTAPNIPPKAGDKWLANMYRIDRLQNGEGEFTTWSPVGSSSSFHRPDRFGELIFVE